MPALAKCQFTESFSSHYSLNKLHFYNYIEFYLGMDNSSDTVQELLPVSKSLAISSVPAAIFSSYIIRTIPSDAESRED